MIQPVCVTWPAPGAMQDAALQGEASLTTGRTYLAQTEGVCWAARDAEIDLCMQSARKGMNFVSAELMRARDAAGYSSYCERLYAEGLEDLEKRKRRVRGALVPLLRPHSYDVFGSLCQHVPILQAEKLPVSGRFGRYAAPTLIPHCCQRNAGDTSW